MRRERASAMQLSRCVRAVESISSVWAFFRRSKADGASGLEVLSGWIRRESLRYWSLIADSGMPGWRLRTAYLNGRAER